MEAIDAFDQFYRSVYHDRSSNLRSALAEKPLQVKRLNMFLKNFDLKASDPVETWASNCFSVEQTFEPQVQVCGLIDFFVMDLALSLIHI